MRSYLKILATTAAAVAMTAPAASAAALAVGGGGGFVGVQGSMTFNGTDNPATGFGHYAGVLELRKAAR